MALALDIELPLQPAETENNFKKRKLSDSNTDQQSGSTATLTSAPNEAQAAVNIAGLTDASRSRRNRPSRAEAAQARMAMEKYTVLLRPRNNVGVNSIPRKELAAVLASCAPHASFNAMTSTHVNHRSNSITITFYNKTQALAFCACDRCTVNGQT